ncbi:SURF1 family cytochrome oxidase biogenesis protein [Arthrobacter crystallopoietes]|uniref:SURF1 family cytochrome oxidase biogenesis protein n=1 Tax=Crystallibacter crystallopoietes TaxID=37928 RepID=UPI001ABEBED2|nr:SURF1 family protein [Arthrobacter crystallopoietes]QTG80088.1 SURF1 family protein [Arthrobacter crystallopoietes]
MYRFLFSAKWLGWLLLVALLASVCVLLGNWQMDRRDQAHDVVTAIESNYDADPVDFETVPDIFAEADDADEWTPVVLRGEYDEAGQRVVRNRPLNGRPGYEVLVPLKLVSGPAVIVNRGWLPIGNNVAGRPDTVPAAPEGDVTVVARVKPGESSVDRGAPEGQLASIQLDEYAAELDYPVFTGGYGLMAAENPAPAERPVLMPKPAIDEGPHLSYSMQWYAFGVLFFVGYGYAARQQAIMDRLQEEDEEAGYHEANPAPRPAAQKRSRKRPSAEEEEDAVLDAQGFRTDGSLLSERD